MSDKTYLGTGKEITTQFGKILKLSFTESDLQTMQEKMSNGWVNVDILPRREVSPKGQTHYGVLNEWKPEPGAGGGGGGGAKPASKPADSGSVNDMSVEDLPF